MTSSNGNIFRVTGHLCEALMFSLICVWINGWVNNREAGDLRHHRVYYDVTVMSKYNKAQLPRKNNRSHDSWNVLQGKAKSTALHINVFCFSSLRCVRIILYTYIRQDIIAWIS